MTLWLLQKGYLHISTWWQTVRDNDLCLHPVLKAPPQSPAAWRMVTVSEPIYQQQIYRPDSETISWNLLWSAADSGDSLVHHYEWLSLCCHMVIWYIVSVQAWIIATLTNRNYMWDAASPHPPPQISVSILHRACAQYVSFEALL